MNSNVLILLLAGALGLTLGSLAVWNRNFALSYVRHSPKAWIWRKMLGEERAVHAMQVVFGPLAMIVGAVLIAAAAWLLALDR